MQRWKHFAAAVVLLLCFSSSRAIPLVEDFEGDFPPALWLTDRTGNGTTTWQRSVARDAGWGYSAESIAEYPLPDGGIRHWLITPQIIPESGSSGLAFHLRLVSLSFATSDTVSVLVSTTGSAPGDFTHLIATLMPGPNGDFGPIFSRIDLDLSDFLGQPIRVAFVRTVPLSGKTIVQLDGVEGPNLVEIPEPPLLPSPPDQAVGVEVTTELSWVMGHGTASIDLYLSRSQEEVETLSPVARVLWGKRAESFRPRANLLSNQNYYWRVASSNDAGTVVGPVWSFNTGTGPLGGSYQVGGAGGDFATLALALNELTAQGISGPTTISLAGGIYEGALVLTEVPGASADSRLTIRKLPGESPVTIRAASPIDTSAVTFAGADYVTIDGIDFSADGGVTRHCVGYTTGASCNVIRNGILRGPGSSVANSDLIRVQGGQCDSNLFENLRLSRAIEGIRLSAAGSVSAGNIVRGCVIDSVRKGIVVIRQRGCRIQENDITLNAGASDEVDGVYIGTTLPQDSVFVHGNRIHGATTSAVYAVGIRVRTDSATAVVRAYNNFIYDFRNTSSSQVRAVFVSSGNCELFSNSVLINNVSASGTTYGVFIGSTGATGSTVLKNNLFANREASSVSYNVFAASNTADLTSDYNIFQGTGSGYRLGYFGSVQTSLANWQSATGLDLHSLEGDPGFVSDTDLHLQPANGLAHQNGCVLLEISDDVDGEVRLVPPDRGADEYTHAAPALDFALPDFVELPANFVAGSTAAVRVVVFNRGSASQTGVPVRVYFDQVQMSEAAVSLGPLEVDTLLLTGVVPSTLGSSQLSARCFLSGDVIPGNDSLAAVVSIVAAPLNGVYRIGPQTGDYPDFASAVTDLRARGISGPVTYLVEPVTYNEQVTIPAISGASPERTITFTSADSILRPVISSAVGPATVVLAGGDYVRFCGTDVSATLPNHAAIKLTGGACGNVFSRSVVSGSSLQLGSVCGIRIEGGGNHGNEFRNLQVSGATCGIRLSGEAGLPDSGNVVKQCTVTGNCTGILSEYQVASRVLSCVITPGYAGATEACYGVYVGSQAAGSVVSIERNHITGGMAGNGVCGILSSPGAGQALIVNNFISRLNGAGTGAVYGVLARSGVSNVFFNSIWLTEISGTGDVTALADSGATAILVAKNNAVVVSESGNRVWCISRTAGVLTADHNVYYYRGFPDNPLYSLGRDSTVNYITLQQWQTGTGRDENSHFDDPHFVSESDLHVRSGGSVLNGQGISVENVTTDYDGDERGNPPDIGGDEYSYSALLRDFEVSWVTHYAGRFAADSTYAFVVRVNNSGQERGTDVPVGLGYDGRLQTVVVVSLDPGQSDTLTLWWTVPAIELDYGEVAVFTELPGDEDRSNDTVYVAVQVVGPPLGGSYAIGGESADFSSLGEACDHLSARGVSAPVDFTVRPGTYLESLIISQIPGADSASPITFRGDTAGGNLPLVSAFGGSAVVVFVAAHHVTFEQLEIAATGTCTTAVSLMNGATDNSLANCVLRGADSLQLWTAAIRVFGGCDRNEFNGLSLSRAFTGVAFVSSADNLPGVDNRISGCDIRRTRCGVSVVNQVNLTIEDCNIEPGYFTTAAAVCYGVQVGSLGSGGSVRIMGNRIHGFADRSNSMTNRAAGIFSVPGAGGTVLISNNFIYDFTQITRLKVTGIYLSSGTHQVLYNSILLNDLSTANEMAAILISTGNQHTILNNILVSREDEDVSYGILQIPADTLQIDFNDLYGPVSHFVVGRVGTVTYATLSDWQTRGNDLHGLAADPGFVSDQDLHVNPLSDVVSERAMPLAQVPIDIDGEPRFGTPDLGADEYDVQSIAEAPLNLTLQWAADSLVLHWSGVIRNALYAVYADTTAAVTPFWSPLVGTTTDTTMTVPIALGQRGFFTVCRVFDPQYLRIQPGLGLPEMSPKSQ